MQGFLIVGARLVNHFKQKLQQLGLALQFLAVNPIGFQNGMNEALDGHHALGVEQVGFLLVGGQAVHHLARQVADDFFFLRHGKVEFGGQVDEQQFFLRVVIGERYGEHALHAAVRAGDGIHLPFQKGFFQRGVLPHVNHIVDCCRKRLSALRAGNRRMLCRHSSSCTSLCSKWFGGAL